MSLIHWWSLDEDLKDKITLATVGGTYTKDSNGKIGNCLKSSYPGFQTSVKLVDEWSHWKHSVSMSCWVKINYNECNTYLKTLRYSSTATSPTGCLIGQTSYGGLGIHWYTNTMYNNGTITDLTTINFRGYTRGSSSTAATSSVTVESDKWYHMTLVADYDKKVLRFYVNGSQIGGDTSYSSIPEMTDVRYFGWGRGEVWGGNGPGGYLPMWINDIRIYDHALSQAEVKEISKALVVHYSFNDTLSEPTTNVSTVSGWSTYGAYWTISERTETGLKLYRHTGSTSDCVAIQNSAVTSKMAQGDIWTFSCYLYKNGQPYKSTASGISSEGYGYKTVSWESHDDGYYRITFQIISSPGTWVLHNYFFSPIDIGVNCEMRYMQFEKKDHATPYTPTSREGMLVNEAGYNSNINNCGFVLSKDAVKGSYSSYYKNGEQYSISKNTALNNEMVSTSVWFKSTNTSPKTDYHILISVDGGVVEISIPKNGQLRWGGYTSNNSRICSNMTVKNSSGSTFSLLDGKWHLINTIYDGSGWHAYVDGVYQTKWNATGTISYTNKNLIIGKYNEGATSNYGATDAYIDDVKIYNTILTSDDIKEIYQTKAYISDKGDMMCGEFIEDKADAMVTEKSTFECKEVYEEIDSAYEQLEYIESSGTQYVDTGYVTTSTDYTYELDMTPTKIGGFYSYMGFMASGTIPRTGIHEFSNVFMLGADTTTSSSTQPVVNERVVLKGHFKSGAQKLYKNGTLIVSNSVSFNHSANTLSTYIFGRNCSSGRNLASIKLYNAKIYVSSTLVRNFIPCKRKSDNVLGLYDSVNKVFYTNAGSGTFGAGPVVTNSKASIYEDGHISGREIIEI